MGFPSAGIIYSNESREKTLGRIKYDVVLLPPPDPPPTLPPPTKTISMSNSKQKFITVQKGSQKSAMLALILN